METTGSNQTIVLDTPAQIEGARIIAIKAGLRMEARGMKMSRGRSALTIAREMGLTNKRTAKGALADLEVIVAQMLGE